MSVLFTYFCFTGTKPPVQMSILVEQQGDVIDDIHAQAGETQKDTEAA
jgi:hypothetical protein